MNWTDCLFLFDIDGTLIDTGGDGKRAMVAALQEALHVRLDTDFSLLGGIDVVFFRHFYRRFALPEAQFEAYWESFQARYHAHMQELAKNPWIIFPNASQVVAYLDGQQAGMALATGNMKIGAELKLGKFGLNRFFHCGGYGDNADSRTELVRQALASAADFYQKEFAKENIYLFGDTEKDIQSALENGITPVLIDPKNKNRANASLWQAQYYGNFSGFANFLKQLEQGPAGRGVIYF